jgi:hypothetical protein
MDDSSTEPDNTFNATYEDIEHYSAYSEPSIVSNLNGLVKGMKIDPTSHTIKLKVGKSGERKYKKIELYSTPEHLNALLFNAVTGIPYYNDGGPIRYRVGTLQEDDVFKVKYMTGLNGVPPVMLCYDTPEQFEKHLNLRVGTDVKEKWYKKNQQYKTVMGF